MQTYLEILKKILNEGQVKTDRTGTGTISLFGHQSRYSLRDSFPLLTTKKIHLKSVVHELLWFISGDTNVKYLQDNGVRIWNEWADDNGDLGPVYGHQWRSWLGADGKTHDQLAALQDDIRNNPDSRRLIINAWNVGQIEEMALPPCHTMFQFYVANGELSCQLYQRSADVFLGVPFNVASYSLLTCMLAQTCGLKPGEFIHTLGDAHIYSNHMEQVKEQLSRTPTALPQLKLNPNVKSVFDFTGDDIEFLNYQAQPVIRAQVAV